MKKLFFLCLLTASIFNCRAQIVHSAEHIILPLPKGAQKLTAQQVNTLTSLTNSQAISKFKLAPPYNFRFDNIVINIYNIGRNEASNNLTRKKASRDEGFSFLKRRGNNSYHSVIKDIYNKRALIVNYTYGGHVYCFVDIQNSDKTFTLPLKLSYPEADSVKAAGLLDDILNNAQFTQ
ncbi:MULTISPECIES: hypothetical protein [unclassified Mucilaginibacter]|uniref:hypothetical protein n=1 Tax=unclassified Mucilaginibacter TaxID=2617802 RepID=UPI000963CD43|nr:MULTISPECIES: hypothetical protein [unclassified Mucilaginibacter]OJW17644.1 MAG: hypothetical protein BGO48_08935 [Mucilaginibacter sp. 44-25]PLW90214.1 MAG: hypothetical protein C0154_07540 [Mucilaginibacter sp.]PMP64710.1 MAG: hypothetical protein C0191_05680 [Mucilaginibacter sp.]HEK19736.1 hypothetical protein [Bacteroidota bacterium]